MMEEERERREGIGGEGEGEEGWRIMQNDFA